MTKRHAIFEDTKAVMKSRKSKDRQCNDQRTHSDSKHAKQKTKERATQHSLKAINYLKGSESVNSFCSTSVTSCPNYVKTPLEFMFFII